MIQRIKRFLSRTRALEACFDNADTAPLLLHLSRYPDDVDAIVCQAESAWEGSAYWVAISYGLGLALADVAQCIRLWKKVLDPSNASLPGQQDAWRRLESPHIKALYSFLSGHLTPGAVEQFCSRLSETQLQAIQPKLGDPRYLVFVRRLLELDKPTGQVSNEVVSEIERIILAGNPTLHTATLNQCDQVACLLFDGRRYDQALKVLTMVSFLPNRPIQLSLLQRILGIVCWLSEPARAEERIEQSQSAHDPTVFLQEQGFETAFQQHYLELSLIILRTADLCRRNPNSLFIDDLRKLWLHLESAIWQFSNVQGKHHVPSEINSAAAGTLMAMGVCAACNTSYSDVETSAESSQLEGVAAALKSLYDQDSEMVERYKLNSSKLLESEREIALKEIRELRDRIEKQKERFDDLNFEHRQTFSPGFLLLLVLGQGHQYDAVLRQGAAWGLVRLGAAPHLNETSRERIWDFIYGVLGGEEYQSFVEELDQLATGDTNLKRFVRNAAHNHFQTRNKMLLHQELAPRLPPELLHGVEEKIASFHVSFLARDFEERVVQFFPDQRLSELEEALRTSLQWLAELVAPFRGEGRVGPDFYQNLRWLLRELQHHIPKALDFFCRWPLRLMTLEEHKQKLGVYVREGCQIGFWTRFSPPRWRRGADPNQVGKVHARYLDVENRAVPNSIGIYFRLFSHPVLTLPVIYHEFLHYGGSKGVETQGIENETEVALREMLFARMILALLAPRSDNELPAYEADVLRHADQANFSGFVQGFAYQLDDKEWFQTFEESIRETYGGEKTHEEAATEIDDSIRIQNALIEIANATEQEKLQWCPEIQWPLLNSQDTSYLTNEYRMIREKRLTSNHRLSFNRAEAILSESENQYMYDAWKRYRNRKHALDGFTGRVLVDGLVDAIRRFIIRFEGP